MTRLDPAEFRRVLGHLPTGVTIVTALAAGRPAGMTANSLVSVSLQPPLMLFCPARTSTTWPRIRATGRFCVSVLAAHQDEICRRFARSSEDRFDGVAWHEHQGGPALEDALAWLSCNLYEEYPGGDHTIVVAEVVRLEVAGEALDPLLFYRGAYGTFAGRSMPETAGPTR